MTALIGLGLLTPSRQKIHRRQQKIHRRQQKMILQLLEMNIDLSTTSLKLL